MQAGRVVQLDTLGDGDLDVLNPALGPLPARKCRLWMSWDVKIELNASAAALSYESPLLPTEATT